MEDVARGGRTVLFVSHNMAAVQGLCTRCLLLRNGLLQADGPPKEIVEQYLAHLTKDAQVPLSQRADRQGSGRIRFTKLTILNASGQTVEHALSGQDVAIAMNYCSADGRPVAYAEFTVTFHTALGQFMFNCSTASSGLALDALPPTGRLVCHIPELPLAPGRYTLHLLARVGGQTADQVEQAGYLDVLAGDYFGTGQLRAQEDGFLVKHRWSVAECDFTG